MFLGSEALCTKPQQYENKKEAIVPDNTVGLGLGTGATQVQHEDVHEVTWKSLEKI